jgi:hypothetical protein
VSTIRAPILELLAAPLDPEGTVEGLAERLLSLVAADPAAEMTLTYEDLLDRQSQRLIRPLLACLAQKSETETGKPLNLFTGPLEFVRIGPTGRVHIHGEFENRPGAVRLILRALQLGNRATPPASSLIKTEDNLALPRDGLT